MVNLYAVLGGEYDITTVYKFNTQEEADANGEVIRTYLDTCDVSVHAQTNAVGLPFLNINGNNKSYPESLIYPSKTSTIPTLEEPFENSPWKTLTLTGAMEKLGIKELYGVSPLDVFPIFDSFKLVKSLRVIQEAMSVTFSYDPYQGYEYFYNEVFSSNNLLEATKKKDVFLSVRVTQLNSRSFKFRLKNLMGNHTLINVYANNNTINVCDQEKCENYVYETNNEYQISLYVSLDGKLVIYDVIAQKYLSHGKKSLGTFKNYDSIDQDGNEDSAYSKEYIKYQIVQIVQPVLSDDKSIVTPWLNIKTDLAFYIISYRKKNSRIQVFLRDKDARHALLKSSEQTLGEIVSNETSITMDVDKIVLTKVDVKNFQNWTQEKQIEIATDKNAYITNIWETGQWDHYKIYETTACAKNNTQEIYNVALKNITFSNKVDFCLNGGIRNDVNGCICPPGFTGDSCEFPCGKNYFGRKCSKLCSETEDECKGMILCTSSFGCSCAPGYYGDKCLQECEEGTYGADCNQTCGRCVGGCDRYSGYCRGECDSPYLIWPSCKFDHSYWTDSPVVKDSNSSTITVSLYFNSTNVKNYLDETRLYMIQYKENTEIYWNNCSYEKFHYGSNDYVVEELKPGRKYLLRTLLIDKSLKINDPELSKISTGKTKCIVSTIENSINVTEVTNSSIALLWNKETSSIDTECPFSSYIVYITHSSDENANVHRKIFNLTSNKVLVKYLKPGELYLIELKKNTVHGESPTISNITVRTDSTIDNTLGVVGLVTKIQGSDIYLEWLKSPFDKTYYIKYKLLKRLSCSGDEIMKSSSLQMVSTTSTNYTLSLEPNAQYLMFVTIDPNQITNLINVTTFTDGTVPSIPPTLLLQKTKITNDTVLVYWTDPKSSCTRMNGFFKRYMIELLNNQNAVMFTYQTIQKQMQIIELSPKTDYKLRIRYVNHIGFNPHYYAEHVFSTKATSFLSPQNLTAYKTTASLIGLRWKMPETNTTISGINVNIQNQIEKNSFNITDLTLLQCKAWPSYVCYTIQNLKHNKKYEVSIDIFSEEFPEGGSQKTIQVLTRETMPSPVTEIKVNDIFMPNLTLSWRIPYFLNGILRKFQIEIEHLSSFDETLCCQAVSTINYVVKEEQEIYSHVLENMHTASSYQITIRAFTRRLGQEASKIIETPPPSLPMKQIPEVTVEGTHIVWDTNEVTNKTSDGNDTMIELVTDVLVIVKPNEIDDSIHELNQTRIDLDSLLKSSNWWIAHVCGVNADCSINLGTDEESDSPYGKIRNKPLTAGYNYTIVAIQINKHLSARSYTVVKSAPFVFKGVEGTSTTTEVIENNFTDDPPLETNEIVEDYQQRNNNYLTSTTETSQNGQEELYGAPIDDYESIEY